MTRMIFAYLKILSILLFLGLPSLSFAENTVLVFIVDGLQGDAAKVAAANGAQNLKFLMDNGVWVEETYCTSPAPRMALPDGSLPWGTTTSSNVSMHTGTHVFESRQMDDIFLSARQAKIKSVFAGGAGNYKEFTTPDFTNFGNLSDSVVVQHGIDHFKKDGVRLIRLHLQQIRDSWTGPEDKIKPDSRYQQAIQKVDVLLGKLIQTFKSAGVWDSTYVILGADHGMGVTNRSEHPPSVRSSWSPVMNFYGPGIKKGSSIPYAETPDMAIMINHFLHLKPLQGHTDPKVTIEPKGTTGTFLSNIFEGNPREIKHPKFIHRYLESKNWKPSDDFGEYRLAMLSYMKELVVKQR
ncbi:MAG: alkaline phosphatase family protein [Candidatus Latescibacter sp.]|nr:alkaline phosphatase family protein [Candidatus Latescibacter sp.]